MQTKTVAQCVEFYYTYKRQVKIGRNGALTYGPPQSSGEKQSETVVDVKVERVPLSHHKHVNFRVLGSSPAFQLMEEMAILKIPS